MKTCTLAILILLLVSGFAPAQDGPRLVPRRLLVRVYAAADSVFTAGDALMISRSLNQRLQEADPDVIFMEPAAEPAGPGQEQLNAAAEQAGADSWMQVSLEGGWASSKIRVRAFDVLLRTAVTDLTVQRTTWGSASGLSQESWADVAQAIAGKFPMLETSVPASDRPRLVRISIKALPGSAVTGLGTPPLKIGAEGSAFRMVAPRKEYLLRTDLAGYEPVTTRVYLSTDRELEIRQQKPAAWGLEGSLSDSRAPGADVSVYFPSSFIFVRYGFSTYAIGLALDSSGILLGLPLTNLAAQIGTYLSPQDRFFRFYLALGGLVRVVHAENTRPVLDSLAPAGIRLAAGVESPVSDHGKLYLELTPTLYQTRQPDALRAALGQDNAPGWAFGPGEALNFLSFRVGYRWRP